MTSFTRHHKDAINPTSRQKVVGQIAKFYHPRGWLDASREVPLFRPESGLRLL